MSAAFSLDDVLSLNPISPQPFRFRKDSYIKGMVALYCVLNDTMYKNIPLNPYLHEVICKQVKLYVNRSSFM